MTNPVPESEPHPLSSRGRAHGKLSSWLLVIAVLVAFTGGGIAMIMQSWVLFWVCAAVVIVSVPMGRVIRIMDDTMQWTHAVPADYEGNVTLEATRRRRHEEASGDRSPERRS
jgi:hypothetical protein